MISPGHQREPGDAHRHLQAGEHRRQRARDDHRAEDVERPGAETARGPHQVAVDRAGAEQRVQRGRVERRQEGQEHDRRLRAVEHEDRDRDPGQDRDRPHELEHREDVLAHPQRPAEHQAERDAEDDRQRERLEHPPDAGPDVVVVAAGVQRRPVGRVAARPLAEHVDGAREGLEAPEREDVDGQVPGADHEGEPEQGERCGRAEEPGPEPPPRRVPGRWRRRLDRAAGRGGRQHGGRGLGDGGLGHPG